MSSIADDRIPEGVDTQRIKRSPSHLKSAHPVIRTSVLAGTGQAILYFASEGVVINRIPSGKIQQERRSGFVNPTRSGMQKERAMTETEQKELNHEQNG